MSLSTPVVFIIFNRPDLTEIVFKAISQARPKKLLIIADGPRFSEDIDKCEKARAIIDRADWDCELFTNFSEINLGCKKRISSGLNWTFQIVDSAIILEDDCLPDFTFFNFCEELIEKYKDDTRFSMISGNNYLDNINHIKYSYYFSRYTHIWGWATWRRAWNLHDPKMTLWPEFRDKGWPTEIYETYSEAEYRRNCFEKTYSGIIDTWDYAWSFSCLAQNGLVIRPAVNLVSNIGFGENATHTKAYSRVSNFPKARMNFPLKHPPYILRDSRLDRKEVKLLLDIPNYSFELIKSLLNILKRMLKRH